MAEKIDPKIHGIAKEDLVRVVKEAGRMQNIASEYTSTRGQYIRTQIDNHSLNRKALGMVCNLDRMSEEKRTPTLRDFIEYSFKNGFFDQLDAFDNMVPLLEQIVDHIRGNSNRRPADPLISTLAGN